MKFSKNSIALTCFLFSLISFQGFSQVLTDIEGDVKIRGSIDVHYPDDSTSLHIGLNSGHVNSTLSAYRSNTYFGTNTGRSGTLAGANSFFGAFAGEKNTAGGANSFFGAFAGEKSTIGGSNSFFGGFAGYSNSIGFLNSFIGARAGFQNSTGGRNSFFGADAGFKVRTSTRNTYIGVEADQLTFADSLDRSMALGYNAKVDCSNCAVIGGTGEDQVNVGINTPEPATQLTIKQATAGDNSGIRLISSVTNLSWEIRHTTSGDNLRFRAFANDGTTADHTVEIRRSDGAYLQNSDVRLKRDIVYFENKLEDIIKIKPAAYNWKNQTSESKPSLGVIAQELELLFPSTVTTNEDGYKMVNYDALAVLSIQAIKELKSIVDLMSEQNEQLSKRLEKLEESRK